MTLLLLGLACAPAERPDWTAGEDRNLESLTYYGGVGSSADPDDGATTDTGAAADDGCEALEGSWTFTLTTLFGDCSIPSATVYNQSLSCGDDGTFTLQSSGLALDCTLSGSAFGCHTPDPTYSFAVSGSISDDTASGTWTWRFPSACDSVSGSFQAER